jgi:peptidoglycan DL-endopeptidase CwlO
MSGPGRRVPHAATVDSVGSWRQGSHVSPGPTTGVPLSARPRRLLAATLVLPAIAGAVIATAPAPATPLPPPPLGVDDTAAEVRAIAAAQRANRTHTERPEPPAADAAPETAAEPQPRPRPEPRARRSTAPQPRPRRVETQPIAVAGDIAVVIAFALAQVGKPYVWGAAGPSAYDCSGLLQRAFAQIGVTLPHSSGGIAHVGRAVPRSAWAPGTVLTYPGHVAIYLGGGRMVHASHAGRPVSVAAVYGSPQGRQIVGSPSRLAD